MRRRSILVGFAGAFGGAVTAFVVLPNNPTGALAAAQIAALLVMTISATGIVVVGRNTIRDRILGKARAGLFPPGRCHACGYDTSALVRGIFACPECGAVLASIPAGERVPGDGRSNRGGGG